MLFFSLFCRRNILNEPRTSEPPGLFGGVSGETRTAAEDDGYENAPRRAAPPAAPDALARLEQTLAAMEQRRARDHKMLLIAIVVFASLTLHRLELMQQRLRALGA